MQPTIRAHTDLGGLSVPIAVQPYREHALTTSLNPAADRHDNPSRPTRLHVGLHWHGHLIGEHTRSLRTRPPPTPLLTLRLRQMQAFAFWPREPSLDAPPWIDWSDRSAAASNIDRPSIDLTTALRMPPPTSPKRTKRCSTQSCAVLTLCLLNGAKTIADIVRAIRVRVGVSIMVYDVLNIDV